MDEAGALMVWDAVYEYADVLTVKEAGNRDAFAQAQALADRAQAEAVGR